MISVEEALSEREGRRELGWRKGQREREGGRKKGNRGGKEGVNAGEREAK